MRQGGVGRGAGLEHGSYLFPPMCTLRAKRSSEPCSLTGFHFSSPGASPCPTLLGEPQDSQLLSPAWPSSHGFSHPEVTGPRGLLL